MEAKGFELWSLPWETFELVEDDPDHFTWNGFVAFSEALVRRLVVESPDKTDSRAWTILSDSTVDHNNYDERWERTGRADEHLTQLLHSAGVNATVDSVCGSGFLARKAEDLHFATRRRRSDPKTNLLIVGGWNDETHQSSVRRQISLEMAKFAK